MSMTVKLNVSLLGFSFREHIFSLIFRKVKKHSYYEEQVLCKSLDRCLLLFSRDHSVVQFVSKDNIFVSLASKKDGMDCRIIYKLYCKHVSVMVY